MKPTLQKKKKNLDPYIVHDPKVMISAIEVDLPNKLILLSFTLLTYFCLPFVKNVKKVKNQPTLPNNIIRQTEFNGS
jgi:hypothetical protein